MLVAAGAAANMASKARREGLSPRAAAPAPQRRRRSASAGTGRDSSNTAERLEGEGVARAVGGGASTDRRFDSNAPDGAEARAPGTADVSRGG